MLTFIFLITGGYMGRLKEHDDLKKDICVYYLVLPVKVSCVNLNGFSCETQKQKVWGYMGCCGNGGGVLLLTGIRSCLKCTGPAQIYRCEGDKSCMRHTLDHEWQNIRVRSTKGSRCRSALHLPHSHPQATTTALPGWGAKTTPALIQRGT